MTSHRNEKHWLTNEENEDRRPPGEVLEDAVDEIRNLLPRLESAFSAVELTAAAVRDKKLGFEGYSVSWPASLLTDETFGMAWTDDEAVVAELEPPPDLESGWKLDPQDGDRLRYWWGDEWDVLVVPAPGNLDAYMKIEAGERG